VHYDFDGAQQKLQECDAVIDNDYFLTAIKADFLESARLFMFETYCRIHQVRPRVHSAAPIAVVHPACQLALVRAAVVLMCLTTDEPSQTPLPLASEHWSAVVLPMAAPATGLKGIISAVAV
jgi:hypothetical protein